MVQGHEPGGEDSIRLGNGREACSPLGPPEDTSPADPLTLAHGLVSESRTVKEWICVCYHLLQLP